MSTSYAVSQSFSPRLALWVIGAAIVRMDAEMSKALHYASALVQIAWLVVEALIVSAWKGKPSLSTWLVVGKALALATLPAAGMVAVFVAPMAVVCAAVLVAFAFVTKPK